MADRFERHKQPWTGDELGKLKILAAKGKGLKEIAKALGRMQVLPDWGVVLEDFQTPKGGGVFQRSERFLLPDLEVLAWRTARFARLSQLLSGKLEELQILPPL